MLENLLKNDELYFPKMGEDNTYKKFIENSQLFDECTDLICE